MGHAAVLGLIVLVALGLRLHRLGDVQLWVDETDFYYEAVYQTPPVGLVAHVLERRDRTTNTVGWPAIVWLSARVFGHDLVGARLATVLLSIALIISVYFLARSAFSSSAANGRNVAGLAAAVFATISMTQMELSQRAFAYGGIAVFSAMILLCHMRVASAVSRPEFLAHSSGLWVLYATAMALSLFVHPSMGLAIAASQLIIYGTLVRNFRGQPAGRFMTPLALTLLSTLATGLSALLNAKNPAFGRRGYLTDYYHPPDGGAIPFVAGRFVDFLAYHLNPLWDPRFYWPLTPNLAVLPLVAVCVLGWVWAAANHLGKGGRRLAAVTALMVAIQVCGSLVGVFPFGGVRQSMFLAPVVFAFAGVGFWVLWRSRSTRYAAVALAVIYLAWWSMTLPRFYHERVRMLEPDQIVRLWEQAGRPPVYATAGDARVLRHAMRGVDGISVRDVGSIAQVPDDDLLLISLRWPIERDAWEKRFTDVARARGFAWELLVERPAAHLNSWRYPTSLYFPPNGLWIYRFTRPDRSSTP